MGGLGRQVQEWMEQQGVDPAAITYAELIDKQCERGGRWQDALTLFEEMEVRLGS